MANKGNIIDSYDYGRISCNNKKIVDKNKKVYNNKKQVIRRKRKRTIVEKDSINKNILLNIGKIITTYEINHNNYIVYDNYHYVDIDKLHKLDEEIADKKRSIQIKNR